MDALVKIQVMEDVVDAQLLRHDKPLEGTGDHLNNHQASACSISCFFCRETYSSSSLSS